MTERRARILVVDDNPAIHDDFRKILIDQRSAALDDLEAELFGAPQKSQMPSCEVESAFQGKDAFELVQRRLSEGVHFTTAFVDMRMPPGWDGVQTIEKLWSLDPDLEIVVCTAYSDHTWAELGKRFGCSDKLLILKKPFDPTEARQLASALTEKWFLRREAQLELGNLEQLVDENTRLMQSFFDGSPYLMALAELSADDVKILMYNRAAHLRLPQLATHQGALWMRDLMPGFSELWRKRLCEVQASGRPSRFEDNYTTPVGTVNLVFSVAPVPGTENRFSVYGEDITERRKMESLLKLQERMASIGTLAAGVAHEINNPLAFVAGNLDFLEERLSELPVGVLSDLPQIMAEMREGTERVRRIVRDLKVYSRSDEERPEPLDLRPLLDSSINMLAHELRNRAKVVRHYEDACLVTGNGTRFGQVFLNLLSNAAQAIPEGAAESNQIHVSLRRDGGHVVVRVRDTGCGIPPHIRERIFDPFFTTKPSGTGTGLGLSICHHIIHDAGGEISVDSEPGRGSTFTVRLPALAVDARLPAKAPADRAPQATPAGRKRILVVDDEPVVSQVVSRVLKQHDCVLSSSAAEALSRLAEPFDLIICDLMMPVMSGMELYRELNRRLPEMAQRMVFVTGGAFTSESQEFAERFPERVLEKPLDVVRLRRVVESMLAAMPPG